MPWLVDGAVVLAAAAFAVVRPPSGPAPVPPVQAAPARKADEVSSERLVGRWLRPDGGYVLEIRGAQADGRLNTAYLTRAPSMCPAPSGGVRLAASASPASCATSIITTAVFF